MEVVRMRMAAQGLSRPLGSADDVVRHLVGLQAQDNWVAPYAIRPRLSPGAEAQPQDTVVTWLMRGTLHLVTAAEVGWLTSLLGPIFVARSRPRRMQLGLTDDLLAKAVPMLSERLPATRAEIMQVAEQAGVPQGQARAHLLAYAGLTGVACLTGDGLWKKPQSDGYRPEHPLMELCRRYKAGYGPAKAADFAAWSGLPITMVRKAFDSTPPPERIDAQVPRVRLLGHLDPYLLGYKDRSFALDPKHTKLVQRGGGFLRPIVLVDGRVAGIWDRTRKADRLVIAVEPFTTIPIPELEAEAADLTSFVGAEQFTVSWQKSTSSG